MATQIATLQSSNVLAPKPAAAPPSTTGTSRRVRPYRDYLTPALHRRFSHAAVLMLAICYLESIIVSPPRLFWIWNPISLTGIRALLLFLPCLAVFIVRVANMHCGELNTPSAAADWRTQLLRWRALHTFCWYLGGALFFGEVYIWSQKESAHLGWVDAGRDDEWALLNENPIWLRGLYLCLAVVQSVLHLVKDYDRIPIGTERRSAPGSGEDSTQATPANGSRLLDELRTRLLSALKRTSIVAPPTVAFNIPVYFFMLRRSLWAYFYTLGRAFFPKLTAQARPTGFSEVARLMSQSLLSAFLLVFLWQSSSAAFTAFVARQPLSKVEDQPLTGLIATSDKSRDPNESLLSGLKSKKEVPRAFSFWELALICTQFDVRRKTIYSEVDRAGGSTWNQISKLCLDEISAVQTRIKTAQQPAQTPPSSNTAQLTEKSQLADLGMPKIADRNVQSGDVWTKPRADMMQSIGSMARSTGHSQPSQSALVPTARRAIGWGADRMLSKEEQAKLTPNGISKQVVDWVSKALKTSVGEPFRQTFARSAKAVIFGEPHSMKANIVHASHSISALCVKSVQEDVYGQVAKSVALVIRTYVETIQAIQKFIQTTTPDWTDVTFENHDRRVPEVEELVNELKQDLEQIVLVFGEYQSSIGLTKKELREARELLGER